MTIKDDLQGTQVALEDRTSDTSNMYAPPKSLVKEVLSEEEACRKEDKEFDRMSAVFFGSTFVLLGTGALVGAVYNLVKGEGSVASPLAVAGICAPFAYKFGRDLFDYLRSNSLEDSVDESVERNDSQ